MSLVELLKILVKKDLGSKSYDVSPEMSQRIPAQGLSGNGLFVV